MSLWPSPMITVFHLKVLANSVMCLQFGAELITFYILCLHMENEGVWKW